jgi:hypothetical protein
MKQSRHVESNALQVILGVFMRSANTPVAVIEVFAHLGLLISPTSIRNAITSLSKESACEIKAVGSTLLASLAYDNFNMNLKQLVPTVDGRQETMLHMTSATFIPLQHNVTLQDLSCLQLLLERYNRRRFGGQPPATIYQLFEKVNDANPDVLDEQGLDCRKRFNAWKFWYDLVHHGPQKFRRFLQRDLGHPEQLKPLELVKTEQRPLRATDHNQSTIEGNIAAVTDFL